MLLMFLILFLHHPVLLAVQLAIMTVLRLLHQRTTTFQQRTKYGGIGGWTEPLPLGLRTMPILTSRGRLQQQVQGMAGDRHAAGLPKPVSLLQLVTLTIADPILTHGDVHTLSVWGMMKKQITYWERNEKNNIYCIGLFNKHCPLRGGAGKGD